MEIASYIFFGIMAIAVLIHFVSEYRFKRRYDKMTPEEQQQYQRPAGPNDTPPWHMT